MNVTTHLDLFLNFFQDGRMNWPDNPCWKSSSLMLIIPIALTTCGMILKQEQYLQHLIAETMNKCIRIICAALLPLILPCSTSNPQGITMEATDGKICKYIQCQTRYHGFHSGQTNLDRFIRLHVGMNYEIMCLFLFMRDKT